MKLNILEACTIFPDGLAPVDVAEGETIEVDEVYGRLLIDKGHAVAAAEKTEERIADDEV